MSAPEVAVLNAKLDMVITAIDELKAQYKDTSTRLTSVEGKLAHLSLEHCRIQEEKKDARKPWFSVIPSVVQGLIIAILIYALALR